MVLCEKANFYRLNQTITVKFTWQIHIKVTQKIHRPQTLTLDNVAMICPHHVYVSYRVHSHLSTQC